MRVHRPFIARLTPGARLCRCRRLGIPFAGSSCGDPRGIPCAARDPSVTKTVAHVAQEAPVIRPARRLSAFAGIVAFAALAACDGTINRNFVASAGAAPAEAPALKTRTEMAGGRIIVESPPGYCIDPTTLSDDFALIAACQYLANGTVRRPAEAALITLTLGPDAAPGDLPSPGELADMVDAPFIEGTSHGGLVTARLGTGGDSLFPGSDPEYWRGAMVQGGHMLGLALYAPYESLLAQADVQGEKLLRRLMERIEFLSPRSAPMRSSDSAAVSTRGTDGTEATQ